MLFKILADIVVSVHFLWIPFLFLGALLGVRNKVIKMVHLSGLVFAIMVQVFGWHCPLTHLGFCLRSKYDPTLAYAESFIVRYVEKLVYLELSYSLIFVFTIFLWAFNGWLYLRKAKLFHSSQQ